VECWGVILGKRLSTTQQRRKEGGGGLIHQEWHQGKGMTVKEVAKHKEEHQETQDH
jgi:hypothetical protein